MRLKIARNTWGESFPQEVIETWEAGRNGVARLSFTKSENGPYYSSVTDMATGRIYTPEDGCEFLEALCIKLQKATFSKAVIEY